MKAQSVLCAVALCLTVLLAWAQKPPRLTVMVGSASKPPTEELVRLFEKQTGVTVEAHYGGSGAMLSQIVVTREGDVYFPGSSDFMDKAVARGVVKAGSARDIVYLIPAITVPKGNPKHIEGLKDLVRPGVRLAIGRPDTVCVGLYGLQTLEKAGLLNAAKKNIATEAESCEKTAATVSLGLVDAALGWRDFGNWDPQHLQTVLLAPGQVPRIATIPAAPTVYARDPALAERFVLFLQSPEARAVFQKWGYLCTVEEARRFALPQTPVGGSAPLPAEWTEAKP